MMQSLSRLWNKFMRFCADVSMAQAQAQNPDHHDCPPSLGIGVAVGPAVPGYGDYQIPPAPIVLQRFPKYPLGARLKWRETVGTVISIHADAHFLGFFMPLDAKDAPSSTDQIFYGLMLTEELDGRTFQSGCVWVGENDAELVPK